MVDIRPPTQPLDYRRHGKRRRAGRGGFVALVGAMVALGGVVVFVCAHSFTETDSLVAEHRRQHELMWAAFGIALLLSGTMIAAVGLRAWCGTRVDNTGAE